MSRSAGLDDTHGKIELTQWRDQGFVFLGGEGRDEGGGGGDGKKLKGQIAKSWAILVARRIHKQTASLTLFDLVTRAGGSTQHPLRELGLRIAIVRRLVF